jgi:hypothetical protein
LAIKKNVMPTSKELRGTMEHVTRGRSVIKGHQVSEELILTDSLDLNIAPEESVKAEKGLTVEGTGGTWLNDGDAAKELRARENERANRRTSQLRDLENKSPIDHQVRHAMIEGGENEVITSGRPLVSRKARSAVRGKVGHNEGAGGRTEWETMEAVITNTISWGMFKSGAEELVGQEEEWLVASIINRIGFGCST